MNYLFLTNDRGYAPQRFYGDFTTKVYNYTDRLSLGKWKALHSLILENAPYGENDRFWFPDPDHEFGDFLPDGLFAASQRHNMDLCAPAYTHDSDCSHPHLKVTNGVTPRRVDFIDLGCPVFSMAALRRNLWTFNLNYSGWGIDFLWGKKEACHVLDWLTVKHPGPTAWDKTAIKLGFPDPNRELQEVQRLYL